MRIRLVAPLALGALVACGTAAKREAAPLAVPSGLEEVTIVSKGME